MYEKELKIVSVITPIYQGKKYLKRLGEMISANAQCVSDYLTVEWIIVNDYPQETINHVINSYDVSVKILTHEENKGTQISRIDGIQASSGDYVLLLDQDDRINCNYIKSQMSKMGDADAVVCQAFQQGTNINGDEKHFLNLINREYFLAHGNMIISPGQVLIRKSSISNKWFNNIINNNGSDDYLLWLSMMSDGAKFTTNSEMLFERIINMRNASLDLGGLYKSANEVIDIVLEQKFFDKTDSSILEKFRMELLESEFFEYSKKNYFVNLIQNIIGFDDGYKFSQSIMNDSEGKEIAIYGAGFLGQMVLFILKHNGVKVTCMVDRNYEERKMSIDVVSPNEIPESVGLVIITVYNKPEDVKHYLKGLYDNKKMETLEIYFED